MTISMTISKKQLQTAKNLHDLYVKKIQKSISKSKDLHDSYVKIIQKLITNREKLK